MLRPFLILFLLLTAGALAARAQDDAATPLDGPVVRVDSLRQKPQFPPLMGYSVYSRVRQSGILVPLPYESKEERAARINAATSANVLRSVDLNLAGYRLPHFSRGAHLALRLGRLFLSAPFGFAEGTVPLMNSSNPFVFAATPGWAPYENPYSPDRIPQTVRTEYDFASGTYRLVARPWSEIQPDLSRSFGGAYRTDAVPYMPMTSAERALSR